MRDCPSSLQNSLIGTFSFALCTWYQLCVNTGVVLQLVQWIPAMWHDSACPIPRHCTIGATLFSADCNCDQRQQHKAWKGSTTCMSFEGMLPASLDMCGKTRVIDYGLDVPDMFMSCSTACFCTMYCIYWSIGRHIF